jgi:hypothetical protein
VTLQNNKRDQNFVPTVSAVTDDASLDPRVLKVDPVTDRLKVNATISGTVTPINALVPFEFDYIGASYPTTSSEVYTYKTGGSGGTTVATITVVYSDAVTKQIITSVTKT